jgi:hypothetical protein
MRSQSNVPPLFKKFAATIADHAFKHEGILWLEKLLPGCDRKPFFVFLVPDKGIAVIEIFPGWEEPGGEIKGAFRGALRIDSGGTEVEVMDLLSGAEELANEISLEIEGISLDTKVPVKTLAVFPTIERRQAKEALSLKDLIDLDSCVFGAEIKNLIKFEEALERLFGHSLQSILTEPQITAIRQKLHPSITIEPHQEMLFPYQETVKSLDIQQEQLAVHLGTGHRIIKGVAGSGKTIVLLKRALHIADKYPDKKILVSCKTKSLSSYFISELDQLTNIDVAHIDKLMWDVIKDSGADFPEGPPFDDSAVARAAINGISVLPPSMQRGYDAILIDEGQDFVGGHFDFIVKLFKERDTNNQWLNIFLDPSQNIYNRDLRWGNYSVSARGRVSRMPMNYRNTKEIASFASNFYKTYGDVVGGRESQVSNRQGEVPDLLIVDTFEEEISNVVRLVRRWNKNGIPSRSIGALHVGGRSVANKVYEALSEEGVFWTTDPNNHENRLKAASTSSPVVLSTVDSAKGLEYRNVVLFGLPSSDEEGAVWQRARTYVGATRATDNLTIVVQEGCPLQSDLELARLETCRGDSSNE